MSDINRRAKTVSQKMTFAVNNASLLLLQRLTLASMLFEDQFYVDGKSSAELIAATVAKCDPIDVANLMKTARNEYKLRHVPLLLARELARKGKLAAQDLSDVIQRPDEIGTFLALYWKEKKQPLSNQVRKGLALAFLKFNEYQFAKWDKNSAQITIRDAMFLTHPKPVTPEQVGLFKKIAEKTLATPDTWETELSAGADKALTFRRLMNENKLGSLAFLRNLRNMLQAGVPESEIVAYGNKVDYSKVLPFRFVAAATHAPQLVKHLEVWMLKALETADKIPGKTVLLVDVSGSMYGVKVSDKSDLDRFDAAAALAMLLREVCESVDIYTFSNELKRVGSYRGFQLKTALNDSQKHGGTALGNALRSLHTKVSYDRIVVFTDEQAQGAITDPKGRGYIVNVAGYKDQAVGKSAKWDTVNGFSEATVAYIQALESV
jgi:60 kDa SS-A/Ro ribonucleoprotein